MSLTDITSNWVTLAIILVVLVVGWTILRGVLRLTMRIFTLGCVGLLILGAVLAALSYFGGR